MELRLSQVDKQRLDEIALLWEMTASAVIRALIKREHDSEERKSK